jgi:EmrB/QacA subfamily drug resistance transporter
VTSASAISAPARGRFLSPSNQRLGLIIVLVCQLMVVLDSTIVNIALQEIKGALNFSATSLSWVVNAYGLAFGGLLLLGARAGDLLGRRRTFLAGILLFTLASFAGGFSQNSGELLAARAIQGVGGALASPSALALLMTMFRDPRERTRAIGYYTAVSIGGAAVGLIAGGVLTQWASWRWVLFVNVPIGIAVLLIGRLALAETERHTGRFDLAGAILSTVGITGLVYGFVHAASDGWGNAETIGSFVIGGALLALFILVELRAESPITPLRLFANQTRVASYIGRLLLVAGMMGMFFFLTQFLQGVLGYSPLASGLAFLPLTVMVFGSSQLSARFFVHRFGGKNVLLVGWLFSVAGLLWLTQLSEGSNYASLLGPLMLFGLGNGTAFVPLTTFALADVEPENAGAASGLVNVMQQVGGALGLAVLVTVFGAASGDAKKHINPNLSPAEAAKHIFVVGADKAFWMCVLLLIIAWIAVAVLIKKRKSDHQIGLDNSEIELDVALSEA